MSEYNESAYYPILVRSIRAKRVVPFDCYVLLSQVNRVVHWIKKKEIFPIEKYEKLQSKNYTRLHIKIEDKQKYFAYLDTFLKTEVGKEVLEELLKEKAEGKIIEGLPDTSEYQLTALENFPNLKDTSNDGDAFFDKTMALEDDLKVNLENEKINTTSTEKLIVDDKAISLDSSQKSLDKDPALKKIIELLSAKVQELDTHFTVKDSANELHEMVIKEITEEIQDEIIKIKDLNNLSHALDIKKTIKDVTEKITEQLLKIKGGAFGDPEGFQVLYGSVRKIEKQIEKMSQIEVRSDFPKINDEDIIDIVESVQFQSEQIRKLIGPSHRSKISDTFNEMIQTVEEHLECKIILDPHSGVYKSAPEYLDTLIDYKKSSLADLISSENEEIIKLKKLIYHQQKTILGLEKDLNSTKDSLNLLKDHWLLFQIQAKNHLDPQDMSNSRKIETTLKNLNTIYKSIGQNSKALSSVTHTISRLFLSDSFNTSNEPLHEIQFNQNADNCEPLKINDTHSKDKVLESEFTTDEVLTNQENFNQNSELTTENNLLQVQIENIQSLLKSENCKNEDFQKTINQLEKLNHSLEDENSEKKAMIDTLTEQIEKLHSAEGRYHETMSDANRKINELKFSIDDTHAKIAHLMNQIQTYEKELDILRKNKNLEELTSLKENQIKDLTKTLAHKLQESTEDKNQNNILSSKLDHEKEQYKLISKKFNLINDQFEIFKKKYRSIEVKATIKEDLLEQTRNSLSKVSKIAENLKSERETYIVKTNQLLKNYKSMIEKTRELTDRATADEQALNQLQQKIDQEKNKENRQREELNEWKVKFSQEQSKTKNLTQEIRALELKIKRFEANSERKKIAS